LRWRKLSLAAGVEQRSGKSAYARTRPAEWRFQSAQRAVREEATASVVIGFLGDRPIRLGRSPIAFPARTAHGPAQEFGLLMRRLEPFAAAGLPLGRRLLRGGALCGLVIPLLRARRLIAALLTAAMALAIMALTIVPVAVLRPVRGTVLRTVAIAILLAAPPLAVEALAVEALAFDARLRIVRAHRGMLVLRLVLGLHLAVITVIVGILVAALHGVAAHVRTPFPASVHLAARPNLVADRHDDAIVMLGVLQVVLGKHRVARG
jgi:hypothetical protein